MVSCRQDAVTDTYYGYARASTKYSIIGVKVWIYKGDVLKGGKEEILQKIEEDLMKVSKEVQ